MGEPTPPKVDIPWLLKLRPHPKGLRLHSLKMGDLFFVDPSQGLESMEGKQCHYDSSRCDYIDVSYPARVGVTKTTLAGFTKVTKIYHATSVPC